MTAPTVAVLWRCTGCGKWSHAKRRPTRHQRTIRGDDPLPHNDDVIIDSWDEQDDGYGGVLVRAGTLIWCGPFDRWVATRTDA